MTRKPVQPRQTPQGVAFLHALSRYPPDLEHGALDLDRTLMLARQTTLIREMLLQLHTLVGRQVLRVTQCNLIVRYRFAMRTHQRGLSGGNGREPQHLPGIARAIGVMDQPRSRDAGPMLQNKMLLAAAGVVLAAA